uniref:Uncharacterized protein n=1 Tax=Nephroselmis olivacea TaxID=31312 RepID=Q9T4C7_NEPOL|nr:hypothetical protein NeolCp092 [Nephroselmis olivacea]NP_050950.1 hypothetical protein NeolCp145 [Nephroselmis olivacea]AAD54868.1 unknown [Nephroselmis olivacea]AAD54921.1 unknown [Nephroselmis olivacea]
MSHKKFDRELGFEGLLRKLHQRHPMLKPELLEQLPPKMLADVKQRLQWIFDYGRPRANLPYELQLVQLRAYKLWCRLSTQEEIDNWELSWSSLFLDGLEFEFQKILANE